VLVSENASDVTKKRLLNHSQRGVERGSISELGSSHDDRNAPHRLRWSGSSHGLMLRHAQTR